MLFISITNAEEVTSFSESSIVIESSTGKVLYEFNSTKELKPASMTKIMSMIIIMDSIKEGKIKLSDNVVISENASSMGGSQVYLNTGESYKVEDLLKSVAIASANDAVVALAEKTYGTVDLFVKKMNSLCKKIGCKNTSFKNPHGLDTEGHYSSSYDMALMARYLINNYPSILKYTNTYEDYLKRPDGSETWLVNTNKLVRFYDNIDGLKTGFTEGAGYCLTSTSKRGNMRLISVVMGVDSIDNRTSDTLKLLNYGFNSYKLNVIYKKNKVLGRIKVEKGKYEYANIVLKKDATELLNINDPKKTYMLNIETKKLYAPVKKGDKIGEVEIIDNEGTIVDIEDITVDKDIESASILDYFKRNLNSLLKGKALS
jgi:serine-type D-Ala-D-Ala carboxypeptidase (penicillin-binding protein 5/6)